MKKRKISIILGVFLICCTVSLKKGFAQTGASTVKDVSTSPFDFKDGDRVVFLGNSLFENDLQYGYLEFAITAGWPNTDITFRNLGWSGDTVFGEARTYITAPSAYDLLIEQLKASRPSVVFVAYGANEAFEGAKGLPIFVQGLNQLLKEINRLGARAVLLSTVPMISSVAEQSRTERNTLLELYNGAISKIATERGLHFIDIFTPLQEFNGNTKLSDNGFHLNEDGYFVLANTLREGLGLSLYKKPSLVIDAPVLSATGTVKTKIIEQKGKTGLDFQVDEAYLPLPPPKQDASSDPNGLELKIIGLTNGNYTLTTNGRELYSASAKEWANGIKIAQAAALDQAYQLQEDILRKNELFFHQYRPLNRTYILGFRSHEQGRHAEGLEELSVPISQLEGQIALNRKPRPQVYKLSPVQ